MALFFIPFFPNAQCYFHPIPTLVLNTSCIVISFLPLCCTMFFFFSSVVHATHVNCGCVFPSQNGCRRFVAWSICLEGVRQWVWLGHFLRKEAASKTLNDGCKSLMSLQSDLLLVVAATTTAADHHHRHRQEVKSRKVRNCNESNYANARDTAIYMFCLRAI